MLGVLSGFFGVGGGFVIVPALVLAGRVPIHRAVATSLLVIALVSGSGVVSLLVSGRPFATGVTILFVAGGVLGMLFGTLVSRRLSGPRLQRVFAAAILAMAVLVFARGRR